MTNEPIQITGEVVIPVFMTAWCIVAHAMRVFEAEEDDEVPVGLKLMFGFLITTIILVTCLALFFAVTTAPKVVLQAIAGFVAVLILTFRR